MLGIPWNESEDELVIRLGDFVPGMDSDATVTKREILRMVASFYDPPGWIEPAVIKLNILLDLGWDDPNPNPARL